MRLNHELIIKSLGEVDDTVIAQILATGASAEELAEAQAWIVNDEPLLNAGKPLPAGRVSQAAEILRTLQERDGGLETPLSGAFFTDACHTWYDH